MSRITVAGPPIWGPSRAWRGARVCSSSPWSTAAPMRNGRAGLPSTAISAAPPPLRRPDSTPISANRPAAPPPPPRRRPDSTPISANRPGGAATGAAAPGAEEGSAPSKRARAWASGATAAGAAGGGRGGAGKKAARPASAPGPGRRAPRRRARRAAWLGLRARTGAAPKKPRWRRLRPTAPESPDGRPMGYAGRAGCANWSPCGDYDSGACPPARRSSAVNHFLPLALRGARRSLARGFTLLELMVVLVIIGVLAALIVPNLLDRADDARMTAARTDITNLMQALKLYRLDNQRYPTAEQGLQALLVKPGAGPMPNNWKPYLDKLPNDPAPPPRPGGLGSRSSSSPAQARCRTPGSRSSINCPTIPGVARTNP